MRRIDCPAGIAPELGVLSDLEIADRVGVSQTTVRRWRQSRGIAAWTPGQSPGRRAPPAPPAAAPPAAAPPAAAPPAAAPPAAAPPAAAPPAAAPLASLSSYEHLLGVETDTAIAQKFGVRVDVVGFERRSRGIPRVTASGPQARRAKDAPRFEPNAAPHRVAIATMLRDARVAAGMTHAALASKLGVVSAHVSLVEHNKRQPSLEVLYAWADACDYDLALTMTRRGASTPVPPPTRSPSNHVDLIALADRMLAAGDKDSAAKVLRAAAVALGVSFG